MRTIVQIIDDQFEDIHRRGISLIQSFPSDALFTNDEIGGSITGSSFGNAIVRSAAEVEKAIGGLTTRLWDDPFEWTLPEELKDRSGVVNYLSEVREARIKGMRFIASDEDLLKTSPAPTIILPVFAVLLGSISKAEFMLGVAAAIADRAPLKQLG